MKKFSLLTRALLVCTVLTTCLELHAQQFLSLSLAEAKMRAAQLRRPLFVHFYANWCLPCQWMEKNTFVDSTVAAQLRDQYVAVKIDVDEVQGYADKESCGIKYLPSILIFNPLGVAIARFEATLDQEEMIKVLYKHATTTRLAVPQTGVMRPTKPSITPVSRVPEKASANAEGALSAEWADDPAHLDALRRPSPLPVAAENPRPGTRKMGIQIGVYSHYENVIRQVQFFEKKFYKPVNISAQTTNGQTYYHLIAGPFDTPAQLQAYLSGLQREGFKGLIVTM